MHGARRPVHRGTRGGTGLTGMPLVKRYASVLGALGLLLAVAAAALACGGGTSPSATPSPDASPRVAARVDGQVVTQAEVEAVRAELRLEGADDDAEAARDEAVRRLLVRHQAAELGVSVPEIDVERRLRAVQAQLGGAEQATAALEAAGMSEAQLRAATSYSLLERALQDRMFRDLEATDAAASAFYRAQRAALFTQPARVRLRSITVPSQQVAKRLAAEIEAGASFADVSRRSSIDPETGDAGGALGWVTVTSLPAAIRTALAPVPTGGLSEPVKFLGRWQIYRVEARRPAEVVPLAQVKSAIRTELTRRKRAAALGRWVADQRAQATVDLAQ